MDFGRIFCASRIIRVSVASASSKPRLSSHFGPPPLLIDNAKSCQIDGRPGAPVFLNTGSANRCACSHCSIRL